MRSRQQVAVVTGGGGGIGAAIAEELGRNGWYVVTVDPMVTVDGSARVPEAGETTAARIVAAGGAARASHASVTDPDEIRGLFHELVAARGSLDAVVNVAGITRPTGFGHGSEQDWGAVLGVHLGGYLNVLGAALPLMAAAGYGRVVGVTSGSGWRAADAGAYSCAKRAVASLTWQIGRRAPSGVTVNAMSPIAATRMVTAALARSRRDGAPGDRAAAADAGRDSGGRPAGATGAGASRGGDAGPRSASGGLALGSMPAPGELGPIGAYMAGESFGWCTGRVLFAGGSEIAVIEEPRLLEVISTESVPNLPGLLRAAMPAAFQPAEEKQSSGGGGNPRFAGAFAGASADPAAAAASPGTGGRCCALVSDRRDLAESLVASLRSRSFTCRHVETARGFDATATALRSLAEAGEPVDAVVVALSGRPAAQRAPDGWKRVLAEHAFLPEDIQVDAAWARATADYAAGAGRPVRLVTLTDATTAGGLSRAQASAQLARAAGGSTDRRVTAFSVGVEEAGARVHGQVGELVAHLLEDPDAAALAGAELATGTGWIGLRSHPRPVASMAYRGPGLPAWLDSTLREVVGFTEAAADVEAP